MHELSISLKTIDVVVGTATQQGFSKVTGITLGIGALSCIEPEALTVGIEFASRETIADGATLSIEMIPGRATCVQCGHQVVVESYQAFCPQCGCYDLKIETGEELKIKHIEVE